MKRMLFFKIWYSLLGITVAGLIVCIAVAMNTEDLAVLDLLYIIPVACVGVVLIGGIICSFFFNRCEHCGSFLQRTPITAKKCPFCGEKF